MTLTKAELARELGVSRSQVTRWASTGMPVQDDGRVERASALRWIKGNVRPKKGGWGEYGRRRKSDGAATVDAAVEAARALEGPTSMQQPPEQVLLDELRHPDRLAAHVRFARVVAGCSLRQAWLLARWLDMYFAVVLEVDPDAAVVADFGDLPWAELSPGESLDPAWSAEFARGVERLARPPTGGDGGKRKRVAKPEVPGADRRR